MQQNVAVVAIGGIFVLVERLHVLIAKIAVVMDAIIVILDSTDHGTIVIDVAQTVGIVVNGNVGIVIQDGIFTMAIVRTLVPVVGGQIRHRIDVNSVPQIVRIVMRRHV